MGTLTPTCSDARKFLHKLRSVVRGTFRRFGAVNKYQGRDEKDAAEFQKEQVNIHVGVGQACVAHLNVS